MKNCFVIGILNKSIILAIKFMDYFKNSLRDFLIIM